MWLQKWKIEQEKAVELEEQEINGYLPELKQVDSLPEYAQHIYKKAHARAVEQYQNPAKRRVGKKRSAEQIASKVAWAAVKKEYEKLGDEWVKKDEDWGLILIKSSKTN